MAFVYGFQLPLKPLNELDHNHLWGRLKVNQTQVWEIVWIITFLTNRHSWTNFKKRLQQQQRKQAFHQQPNLHWSHQKKPKKILSRMLNGGMWISSLVENTSLQRLTLRRIVLVVWQHWWNIPYRNILLVRHNTWTINVWTYHVAHTWIDFKQNFFSLPAHYF